MVDVSSQNNKINITVSSGSNTANVNATPDSARYYSDKSKEWAISDKLIDNEDYSSKYYANKSKKQADISTAKTTEVVESGNTAISNIESARDNAITDITNQESLSVDNVNAAGATQVNNINTAGITQVANVNSVGTTQINFAKEQVTLATNQANIATEQATIATSQASIATSKTTEVVESGNTALSNIETAKNNALNNINTTGAEYVNNAEQYAQNALNSANSAALSESNALSYKNSAQESSQTATEQASIATTSANKAITSANNAKTSETNAKSSEVRCEEILSRLGTAIKIKGRVNSLADLPSSGNLDGDAYLIGEEGLDSYPEYYWYQNHWEFLGTTGTSLSWGLISGDITSQNDLMDKLNTKQNVLTAGTGIDITNNIISNTQTSAEWGNIQGNLSSQTDLQNALNNRANKDLSNLSTTGESKLNNLTANLANKSLTNLNTQGQLYIGKQALMSWSSPADTTGTKAFKLAEMTDVGGNNHPMGLFRWSYITSDARCYSFDILVGLEIRNGNISHQRLDIINHYGVKELRSEALKILKENFKMLYKKVNTNKPVIELWQKIPVNASYRSIKLERLYSTHGDYGTSNTDIWAMYNKSGTPSSFTTYSETGYSVIIPTEAFIHQDKLTAGDNIKIEGNVISSTNSGLEVCDIGMALYVDETKGLRRYLNGQIVDINTNTQAFLNRLKQITTLHPSLLCTEEEWQTAKTMSAFGQVGKFVFNYNGDEIVSVRLPRVVNVQGLFDLQNLGMTVSAGLPNHTHTLTLHGRAGNNARTNRDASWCYDDWAGGNQTATTSQVSNNAIYGKSNTVQPEAIQYPYFIQIATGSETENNIINEIELNTPSFFGDSKYVPTKVNNLSWLKSEGQNNPKGTYPSFYGWILENVNKGVDKFKTNSSYCYKKQDSDYGVWTNSVAPAIGMSVYGHTPMQQIGTISALVENGFTYYDTKLKADTTVYRYTSADNRADYITDYDFVINTTDETFRLPLLDGSELIPHYPQDASDVVYRISSSNPFTASKNGVVVISPYDGFCTYKINGREVETQNDEASGINSQSVIVSMRKGDILTTTNDKSVDLRYYPYVGNGSLYYYVGEKVQNAKLIDAGRIGEQLANKQDKLSRYPIEISNKSLMPSWYVVYNDGWCEQGITLQLSASANNTITLLKPYKDMSYQVLIRQNYIETGNVVVLQTEKMTEQTINANLKHAVNNTYYSRSCDFYTYGYIR